ncbi:MAG TPA: agmatinase family protein [Candidatus Krumholzibacterium sp.]|nr:agmatinase family protein [Candidatus Krumholzibacterium sp.]
MNTGYQFLGEEVAGNGPPLVHIVKVPVELSTSYMKGAADAPDAILEASRQIELYNPLLDLDLEGKGILTLDPGVDSKKGLFSFLDEERERLRSTFTCFIGGEHSITPWILEGMRYGDIGIVWLDAHADLRKEYLGDPESHACAARNSLAYGELVEIGVRSFSSGEKAFMTEEHRVRVHTTWNKDAMKAIDRLPDKVYVSLDFDSIDPSVLRAVGTPEPGGLSWQDLMDIFDHVFSSKKVVGMDAVELCPFPDDEASNFIAAKAVYEAVSRAIGMEASS